MPAFTAWFCRWADRYRLALREDAPPGIYHLLAGMYELATGRRLRAVDQAGQPLADNAILVTTFNIPQK